MKVEVLIPIVIISFMSFLISRSLKPATIKDKGVIVLRKSKFFEILGYITIIVTIAFSIFIFTKVHISTKYFGLIIVSILLIIFIIVMSLSLVIVYKKMKIEVSDEKIKYYGFFNKNNFEISWNEIVKVTYSKFGQELILYTDNTKMRIQMHGYIGFFDFVNKMMTKIDPSLYKDAIQKLQTVYRNL